MMNVFAKKFGLHPLVALIAICVDSVLVAPETVATFLGIETAGISAIIAIVITIVASAIVMVACVLLQRYSYKDNWGAAVGKGLTVGILTAIPTPFPSIVTGAGGVIGIVGLVTRGRAKKKTRAQ
jgi:hypothetical protein